MNAFPQRLAEMPARPGCRERVEPGRRASAAVLRLLPMTMILMTLLLTSGCAQLGSMWYFFGPLPEQKIPAEFKLPKGPILVLVDDDQDLIQPPLARQALVDALAKQFKEHDIADHVTTNEELARIRQSEPNFDRRGAREVGRMAKADTVIWLSAKQFQLEDDLELAGSAAQFAVVLKVVNAKAEERGKERLWPQDREGKLVDVSVSALDIHACKSVAEAHRKLADAMADKIAKYFYDQVLER